MMEIGDGVWLSRHSFSSRTAVKRSPSKLLKASCAHFGSLASCSGVGFIFGSVCFGFNLELSRGLLIPGKVNQDEGHNNKEQAKTNVQAVGFGFG